jgi:hypothetical protein
MLIPMSTLQGTPSDELPEVLSTGSSDIQFAFVSLSKREPEGRDAEYIEWHSLDHRPEQHRLAGLRSALRVVSTPACRAARAANAAPYDEVDHVMTYLFSGPSSIPGFDKLGGALFDGGRMPLRLPTVEFYTADLAGKLAAPSAVAGADVIPFRPAVGIYLLIERGSSDPSSLLDVDGVAGIWWFEGGTSPSTYISDAHGLQLTYLYLEDDPVTVAQRLKAPLRERWASGDVEALLAAPFFSTVPFEWSRYLPTESSPAQEATEGR